MLTDDPQRTVWRFEVNNPQSSSDWRPLLWEFGDDQLLVAQELIAELNRINAPVQLRIVRLTSVATAGHKDGHVFH
jgi:hypothetical protein